MIKPDGSAARKSDFGNAEDTGEDEMTCEVEPLEHQMTANEDTKQEIGDVSWKELILKGALEICRCYQKKRS